MAVGRRTNCPLPTANCPLLHFPPLTTSPTAASRGRLLTVLGVGFGLAVTIGNTIGAGILRTPGTIALHLPSFWAFMSVWIAGALYAMLGANALAELGTLLPRSGGQYVFVRHGLGEYPGFIVGWSDWLSTAGTTAFVAMVVGEYTIGLFPSARTHQVVALGVIGVLTLVQWFGVRAGGTAQNITSVMKALVLLALIVACFVFGSREAGDGTAIAVEREGSLFLAYIIALQAVIYTYDGWSAVIYFSEEVKDPGRSIPRSMFGGVIAITAIYLLINYAFLRVVSLPTIAGKNFAAAVVAERLFGVYGDTVIRMLMVIALISAVNSNVLMAPRVLFAMARDGLFWKGAQEVNRGGTPDVALLISSIVAAVFVVTNTVDTVLAKLAFFFVANYTLSFVALFVLRRKMPDAERPYRAWGHPFTTALALLASIAFLAGTVYSDTASSLWSLGLLFLSLPVYFVVRRR